MKTKLQSFISDHIKPGTYQARFMGRQGPHPGKHGSMLFWEFQVDIKKETFTVAGVSSTSFSTDDRCKAYQWACAIDPTFGPDLEEWDDEGSVGNVVTVLVEDYRTGEEVFSRVMELAPCQVDQPEPA